MKRKFYCSLRVGIYSLLWVAIIIYPKVSMEIHFILLPLVMYLLPDTPCNHTIFGFYHDSLIQWNSFRENYNIIAKWALHPNEGAMAKAKSIKVLQNFQCLRINKCYIILIWDMAQNLIAIKKFCIVEVPDSSKTSMHFKII